MGDPLRTLAKSVKGFDPYGCRVDIIKHLLQIQSGLNNLQDEWPSRCQSSLFTLYLRPSERLFFSAIRVSTRNNPLLVTFRCSLTRVSACD